MDLTNKAEVLGIKGPLVFGDADQIAAIRRHEKLQEYEDIPDCRKCKGDGDCDSCGHECGECDGNGKDYEAYRVFRQKNPNFKRWG